MKIFVLLGDFSILSKCRNFIYECYWFKTFKIKNMCKFKQRPVIEDLCWPITCWHAHDHPLQRVLDAARTHDRYMVPVYFHTCPKETRYLIVLWLRHWVEVRDTCFCSDTKCLVPSSPVGLMA